LRARVSVVPRNNSATLKGSRNDILGKLGNVTNKVIIQKGDRKEVRPGYSAKTASKTRIGEQIGD
jgi:hypothetical protein